MIVVSGVVKGECRHQTGERKPEEPPAITGLVRLRTPAGAAGAEVGGDSPFQSVSPDFLHVNIFSASRHSGVVSAGSCKPLLICIAMNYSEDLPQLLWQSILPEG